MNTVLLDAFGGDNSPNEIIYGAIDALRAKDGFKIALVGDEDKISQILSSFSGVDYSRIEIINAKEVITCEEEPVKAIMRKKDSTFNVGFKALKEREEVKAFISAGSSGAYLVGATLKLGRIDGVDRPALAPILPTVIDNKKVVLLDAGANADCKPINLCQFAVMGSEFVKALGVDKPKVALLSNGTEEKGNALNHEVYVLLKNNTLIDFIGNVEAREILQGKADVVVADGFSGNVALKSLEGAVKSFTSLLKKEMLSSLKGKIAGLLLKKTFKKLYSKMDYNQNGGAILLGVKKAVIKIHGSSKRVAVKGAILQATELFGFDISEKISTSLSLAGVLK